MSVLLLQMAEAPPASEGITLESRALTGDRDAWQALIAKYERNVLLSLLARGVRIDRARELMQETWLRLIEQQRQGKLDRLELPGLAIVQARFLELSQQRQLRAAVDELTERVEQITPEHELFSKEQLARAQAVLEHCPPSAQRVFTLVYEQPQLPHQQVAERVGLSLQRVRQILCETRKRLREALEETP